MARDVLWSVATAQPVPVRPIGVYARVGVRRYSRQRLRRGKSTNSEERVDYIFDPTTCLSQKRIFSSAEIAKVENRAINNKSKRQADCDKGED
mgnify:CR=1 FL=1